jgi:hypothetical protein
LIAGGALMKLAIAGYVILRDQFKEQIPELPECFEEPSFLAGLAVFAVMILMLYFMPLGKAGEPEAEDSG